MKRCVRCSASIAWDKEFCPICGGELVAERNEKIRGAAVAKLPTIETNKAAQATPQPPYTAYINPSDSPVPQTWQPEPSAPSMPERMESPTPPVPEPMINRQPEWAEPQIAVPPVPPMPPVPQAWNAEPVAPPMPPVPEPMINRQPEWAEPRVGVESETQDFSFNSMSLQQIIPQTPPMPDRADAQLDGENDGVISGMSGQGMFVKKDAETSVAGEGDGVFSKLGGAPGAGTPSHPVLPPLPPTPLAPPAPPVQPTSAANSIKKSATATSGEFLRMFPDADPGESVLGD